MKHAVQSQYVSHPDLLYFLSAFVMAFLFAVTLGNLEPIEKTTGYLPPVKARVAASGHDGSFRR